MTNLESSKLATADEAAALGTHYIEDAVRVYLMRDLSGIDKWVIDPASFGESLPSEWQEGILSDECQCANPAECDAVRLRMVMVDRPDGEELMHMLADSLDYTLTKN